MDKLTDFINEECIKDPKCRINRDIFITSYEEWLDKNEIKLPNYWSQIGGTKRSYTLRMSSLGFRVKSSGNKKIYIGLTIKPIYNPIESESEEEDVCDCKAKGYIYCPRCSK